jgi:hypothetical protein
MNLISSHADYRREDYVFARTQSRATSEREWAHREDRLHSWSEVVYPALGLAGVALAVLEVLH